jgi:hypothetical protein
MCEINETFNASSRASGLNVMFLIYVSAIVKGLGHEVVFVAFSCGTKTFGTFSYWPLLWKALWESLLTIS